MHAIQRMFLRRISLKDVRLVIERGEVIEDYPDDFPYPSRLILGKVDNRFLHVVAAYVARTEKVIVVTVYEPNQNQWEAGFRRRKGK